MKDIPSAVFIVDPRKEKIAVAEARKLEIPIVAIVDTNCDPDEADYVIPGNDDAIRAVRLITSKIAEAVLEGKQGKQMAESEQNESPDQEGYNIEEQEEIKDNDEGVPVKEDDLSDKESEKDTV